MKYEVYAGIKVADDFTVFDFISIGRNGAIKKRITFTETEWENIYNLAFGDVHDDGEIRLYRIAVALHQEELSAKFEIYTFVDEKIVPFAKNLKISAFLCKRKKP